MDPTLRPPRYVDEHELGRGGAGRVRRVYDAELNRLVAMKTPLSPDDGLQRFIEEAQVSARLEHPNVLPVYDLGVTSGRELYFTMRYVEGHDSLRRIIDRLKAEDPHYLRRYTFERRAHIAQQLCNALQYAHERGICHRDIKPENILVGAHGEVYLADWGIATSAGADGANEELAGTPKYMSPERLAGGAPPFDPASDVYSLAAVLHELLTLRFYVAAGASASADAMLAMIQANDYVQAKHAVNAVHGAVPPALSHICKKGLAKDPAARFRTADELDAALQRWLEGRAPVACPRTAMQRVLCAANRFLGRHMVLGPALFGAGALTIAGAVVYTAVSLLAR